MDESSCRQEEIRQNCNVQPLLTDLYQITMAYAYWKSGKIDDRAVFDLYFRKNPFQGEFTVFAGLEECLKYLKNFRYSDSDIEYLKTVLPTSIEPAFFEFLRGLTPKDITLSAFEEGCVAFPGVPLIRVEGPLIVGQLLETTLLTLTNFASLMATNAARYRLAAGDGIKLLEFGLRRAQGPDGGLSASRYAHLGGFDGTSNLLAGKLFGIPVAGTHAHSFVTAFSGLDELRGTVVRHAETGVEVDLRVEAVALRVKVASVLGASPSESSDGELASFVSFAASFPAGFTALVDTYDVVRSGLPNFCTVAVALAKAGYRSKGIRIDSGDLAYLSTVSRAAFVAVAAQFDLPWLADVNIVASNDINEETIHSLKEQRHCINTLGIGTHLVTCQRQPALGCVYKMVEVNGKPRIKLSQDVGKVTMPGKKAAYRLFGQDGHALVDLVVRAVEPAPVVGEKVLCRHPFQESKRAFVVPSRVQPLLTDFWRDNAICQPLPALSVVRARVTASMATLRQDIKRHLNPTPFKVSVSVQLYNFIHTLWLQNAPIGELA